MLATSSKSFTEGLMRPSWLGYLIMRMMNWLFHSHSNLDPAVQTRQRLLSSIPSSSPVFFQPNFVMVVARWLKVPPSQAILQLMSFTTLLLWPTSLVSVNFLLAYSLRTFWSREKISAMCWKLPESFYWDQTFLPSPCMTRSGSAFLPVSLIPGGKISVPISFVDQSTLCA